MEKATSAKFGEQQTVGGCCVSVSICLSVVIILVIFSLKQKARQLILCVPFNSQLWQVDVGLCFRNIGVITESCVVCYNIVCCSVDLVSD